MSKKFDIMAVATQVAAATVGGGGAGLVADKLLPQLHDGWKGVAMAGLGAAMSGASIYFKQELIGSAGLGVAGAGGDRMQRFWIGGGGPQTPAAGVGDPDYKVVVDSEVQDYPTSGPEDNGGAAGTDDPGGAV